MVLSLVGSGTTKTTIIYCLETFCAIPFPFFRSGLSTSPPSLPHLKPLRGFLNLCVLINMSIINNKCLLLPLLLILSSSISQNPSLAEARPLSLLESHHHHQGGSQNLVSLGVVCKCCDGIEGACTNTWTDSCSNLQCSPWKYQTTS